ncbi:NIPSNAP family protein [Pseudooceanicola sp. C21-150M6]|uniref:NIPSNAP family protein n=1 Tax=Pseudooceanicola sp. C21-150M6 TaxID=3434355 RepID=UPI003D7FE280
MLTCIIRYDIAPTQRHLFDEYARTWGQCIPRNGADLVGYFSPHEGSSSLAYGIYHIESLAAYETYRERLAADPLGRQNYEFAQREKFIRSESRTWLRRVDQG